MTIHNLHYFVNLMREIRASLEDGTFGRLAEDVLKNYPEMTKAEEE